MLESALQELREAMQTLMDLVHEIDSAFASNIRGATGAIIAFTNKMLSFMNSFDAKTVLNAANIAGINVNFNPLTGQGHDRNAVAQAARWAAMNEWGQAYVERERRNKVAAAAKITAMNRAAAALLNEGDQVSRVSRYFRDANYNSFFNHRGQCTWFAEGRVQELTGIAPQWATDEEGNILGGRNARNWTNTDTLANGTVVNTPSTGSIMVWGGTYGHAAVVERVIRDGEDVTVLYSHANTNGRNFGTSENNTLDGKVTSVTMNQLNENANFSGFVILG